MHIARIFEQPGTHFSFEFFPPKTETASTTLFESIRELTPTRPSFVSVTYGAGGSNSKLTQDLVVRLQRETQLTVVAHMTMVGSSRDDIKGLLERYTASGIENIMALRGDPPKGQTYAPAVDGFAYAAELVAFIKKYFPKLGIGVAGFPEGHPATPNRLIEMDHLKAKVDAGADYICTQLFFDNNDFYDFCERCELAGIKVPIIAGLMPVTSHSGLKRTAELALGARVPARLLRAVMRAEDDETVEKVGVHWATQQAFDLFDRKVAGIHFYTLNRSRPTLKIYDALAVNATGRA
jgi:methylenetetrahydrofolate reductase (NADPH)